MPKPRKNPQNNAINQTKETAENNALKHWFGGVAFLLLAVSGGIFFAPRLTRTEDPKSTEPMNASSIGWGEIYTPMCETILTPFRNRYQNADGTYIPQTCQIRDGQFYYGLEEAPSDALKHEATRFLSQKFSRIAKRKNSLNANHLFETPIWQRFYEKAERSGLRFDLKDPIRTPVLLIQYLNALPTLYKYRDAHSTCGENAVVTMGRFMAALHNKSLPSEEFPVFVQVTYSLEENEELSSDQAFLKTEKGQDWLNKAFVKSEEGGHSAHTSLFLLRKSYTSDKVRVALLKREAEHGKYTYGHGKFNKEGVEVILKQLFNSKKENRYDGAFQCDGWLPAVGMVNDFQPGHCTNEFLLNHPEKVSEIIYIDASYNGWLPVMMEAFKELYPDTFKWLLEPGEKTIEHKPR